MDFGKALEAMNDGQKVRRPIMIDGSYVIVETDKFIAVSNCFGYISQCEFYPSFKDCVADDWEIVPDAPELNPEEILSEFRDWLENGIRKSNRTPGNGHRYLLECVNKLDELSSKQTTVGTVEKRERLIASTPPRYGNSEIVSREIPAYNPPHPEVITHVKWKIELIDGNHAVIKSKAGKCAIVHLT